MPWREKKYHSGGHSWRGGLFTQQLSESRILARFLRMYFPRNWEFGYALSKLRNFGGVEPPKPPPPRHATARSNKACLASKSESSALVCVCIMYVRNINTLNSRSRRASLASKLNALHLCMYYILHCIIHVLYVIGLVAVNASI